MDRRHFLTLAGAGAVSVGALALTACTGPSVGSVSNPTTSSTPKTTGGPKFDGVKPASKISFWSSNPGNSQAVTQQIIDAFTARSGIEVELVTAASYEDVAQKFQAAQAGGGLPDVLTLSDVWWFRFFLND